ncbi:PAS and helix-turn-helix domain-containing protein [Salipiger sp. PrR003]|uniref:PAS and helix-turn-helix domain-containing protein n=1 Tax=Salipiger sp. PrR003 TaxID=2706776 RepID=UPI0013DC36FA|nr:PAS and helix-turn-helix domain-containing protein [Salipiger sp. PrR003]NDV50613.1 PAS and helix-turn-helix domain-containing protein [Salipiger sp. PrR003]
MADETQTLFADMALAAFLESPAPQMVLENRHITDINHAGARLFGSPREELLGRPTMDLHPTVAGYDSLGEAYAESFLADKKNYFEDERLLKTLKGETFWARIRGKPLADEKTVWSIERVQAVGVNLDCLTDREHQVVRQLARGLTSKQAAEQLGCSHRTVETHRGRIMKKLDARNIAELLQKISA